MKKENVFKISALKERVEGESATRTDILHVFGQDNFILIRENQGNLKRNGCGDYR